MIKTDKEPSGEVVESTENGYKVKHKFAAFIMTYERPAIVRQTIELLLKQTMPPHKILVVDNSESFETKSEVEQLKREEVIYYRVGHNSGPAGAAKIGLQILVAEGYEWIFWGDDDDPPFFSDTFERLFDMISERSKAPGIVGVVGQYFKRETGEIIRVPDPVLLQGPTVVVDFIAGNQAMMVNAKVVRAGILPDEKLFFGFEELDFCLKVKKGGYELLVPTALFIQSRQKSRRVNYQRPFYVVKERHALIREYYSVRNMLVILKANGLYQALFYQGIKSLAKAVYGFRYGIAYGSTNFEMICKGIYHAMMNRQGKLS